MVDYFVDFKCRTPAYQSYRMPPKSFSQAWLGVPLGFAHRLSFEPLLMDWTLVQPAPAVPDASVFWEHRSQP